jgi:hypothetical protein
VETRPESSVAANGLGISLADERRTNAEEARHSSSLKSMTGSERHPSRRPGLLPLLQNGEVNLLTVLLPIATLILGALGSFFAESVRHTKSRREALADALRATRSERYIAFVDAAHTAAHTLGRMADGCPNPLPQDPEKYWLVDSEVTQKLRSLEIVGGDTVVEKARAIRAALVEFRGAVESGVEYWSPEYRSKYQPVAEARDSMIRAARDEIGSLV